MQTLTHADQSQSRKVLLLLAGYFLLHLLLRMNLSGALDLDEAEQVLFSQQLRLGYGTQPPLYSWLQALMFSCFGTNLFSLAALKNLLLFVTYACVFFMARPMLGTRGATAVAASLLLLPQIAWESQRDLTHSVLLTCMASATLWCYFALLRKPTVWRYAGLGCLVGLGVQSKYNFALFAFALMIASLAIASHRRIVWNRKMGIAMALALLCFLPHGLWLVDHFRMASAGTLNKMNAGTHAGSYLGNVLRGSGSLLLSTIAFVTPLWLIYAAACFRHRKSLAFDRDNPNVRLFAAFFVVFFACLGLMVLTGKVVKIKDRWLQPVLFALPLAFFLAWPAAGQPATYRRIVQVSACSAILILLALPFRVYLLPLMGQYIPSLHGKSVRPQLPFPQLAAELTRRFPDVAVQVVGDKHLAGNLRFNRQGVRTLLPEEMTSASLPLHGEVLVVSRSEQKSDVLERLQSIYPGSVVTQQGQLALAYQFGSQETISFNYALVRVGSS